MTNFTPIRPGPAHLPQHDSQQTGDQKNSTHSEPPKGSQADHSIYRIKTSAGNAGLMNARSRTAAGKPPSAHEDAAKPFHDASTAPHIDLLENPDDRKKFSGLLIELGSLAVRCASMALTKKECESAHGNIKTATALNEQCRSNVKEHTPADRVQHILTTMQLLKSLSAAIYRNREVFSRLRSFVR